MRKRECSPRTGDPSCGFAVVCGKSAGDSRARPWLCIRRAGAGICRVPDGRLRAAYPGGSRPPRPRGRDDACKQDPVSCAPTPAGRWRKLPRNDGDQPADLSPRAGSRRSDCSAMAQCCQKRGAAKHRTFGLRPTPFREPDYKRTLPAAPSARPGPMLDRSAGNAQDAQRRTGHSLPDSLRPNTPRRYDRSRLAIGERRGT